MNIDTETITTMTEANQNFSKVAKLVEEHGTAVIIKNNVPRYVVMDFSKTEDNTLSEEELIRISERLIKKNKKAYEELAK